MLSLISSYWATVLPAFVTAFYLVRLAQRMQQEVVAPAPVTNNKS